MKNKIKSYHAGLLFCFVTAITGCNLLEINLSMLINKKEGI